MEKAISGIDSLVVFSNTQGVRGRGTLVHISRSVAVFEVYNPFSIIQLSEVLHEVTIMRGERVIYRGKGVVTSIVTTGLMTIVSVTLTDSWSDLSNLQPGPALQNEIDRFIRGWEEGHDLNQSYQLVVNKMSNFLSEISRWLEEAEVAIIGQANVDPERDKGFRSSVERPVATKLAGFLQLFEKEAERVPPEEVAIYKAFARRELHPFMLCAPFAHRTFTKPLGYAGDYEMVNMMLKESEAKGNNTYARIFHDIQVDVAAAAAHRNRITFLKECLEEETERVTGEQRICNVLNVGCGPAVEVQRFIRESELCVHTAFQLMDFNKETIEYVQKRVEKSVAESGRSPSIRYVQKSIDELLKDVHNDADSIVPTFDMVYCAGLFDYFPDNVCRNLVKLYYRWVKPGGLLVATNVHPSNPERYSMEHLLEWYLIYRDENKMASLAPRGTTPEVICDDTGVNVFLRIRKEE